MTDTRHLLHDGRALTYALHRTARARRVSVRVGLDGAITLVVPPLVPEEAALRFLRSRADWALRTSAAMDRYRDRIFLPRGRRDYLAHRERARRLVHTCLARHGAAYGFAFKRVFIKNLTRNWGSCSVLKNLNFNYKLVHLPERHAEYIVVHELCHLEEFNHSPRFWDLVARVIPEHRQLRKELRKYVL